MLSLYVAGTVLFAYFSVLIAGMSVGSTSGVLEMVGFKVTFNELYGLDDESIVNHSLSNQTCGSGNGAAADILLGVYVALLNVFEIPGFVISGMLADAFSRKYTLITGGILLSLGSAIQAASFHFWLLLIGRSIVGFAFAIIYMTSVLYVAEVSPSDKRGRLTSITGPAFNLGILLSLFMSLGYERFFEGWRVSFGVVAALFLLSAIGMFFLPHTPRWLMTKGRDKKALQVLTRVYGKSNSKNDIDRELEEIQKDILSHSKSTIWTLVKQLYHLKYRLFVGITLFFFTSTAGLFLLYYSPTLFCVLGINPFVSSLILGLVILVGGLVPTFLSDMLGRKMILMLASLVNCVVALTSGLLVQFAEEENWAKYLVAALFCVFAFCYSSSWLSVSWVLGAEIFPTTVRGLTLGISTTSYAVFGLLVNQLFPFILGSSVDLHGFLYIMAGENFIAVLFLFIFLPETKGLRLEEMEELFSQGVFENMKQFFRYTKPLENHQDQKNLSDDFTLNELEEMEEMMATA